MYQVTIKSGNGGIPQVTPAEWTSVNTFTTLEDAQAFAESIHISPSITVSISEV